MSTAVAKAKETAVSTEVLDDIFEYAGEGAAFDSSEMQIPFVRLLQALSPQLNKKKAEYIEGASAGDAFNNVTNQYWDGETGHQGDPLLPDHQVSGVRAARHGRWVQGRDPCEQPAPAADHTVGFERNPAQRQRTGQVGPALLPDCGRGRQLPACGHRHEVDPAQGQPSLEDADRDAEGEAPEYGRDDDTSCLRYDVALALRRGVE
jgi:hypothetical protein